MRVEDERILPAFYFALRNTLVANDLEQGTRIAYGAKRFRVVTLNGDVIETSGTMSGGGRSQISGKMGTKVRTNTSKSADNSMISEKALEEMQIRCENLQSQINYSQEQQGILATEVEVLKKELKSNEAEIQKLAITIKSLETQLPQIFKQLEAQRKRMEQTTTDAGKVQSIEESIKEKKEQLNEAEKAAKKVTQKIDEIQTQIDTLHGDKVKTVQSKITSLENQIKKLKANISKLNVESKNNERNVKKLEQQIERLHAEVLKSQDELKQLSEKRQQYDDEITALTKEVEDAKEAIDKAKSESSGVHKEIIAIQKKESDLKLKRIEIEQKLQTVAAKLSDVKAQIPHWRDQLKPLRLHQIPGETEPQQPLKVYTEEELATHTLQDIQYKESVQEELLKKKPNLSCIGEYIEKRDVYLERVKVLEDITSKRNEMRQLYDDVRKKRYNEFMQGFHIITRKLKEMYQMITQGGDAELELVDSMDPFTEGVSFSVRPPKKTWKNISNLSGGEKTLSSLALVFALHYYKPSPLYFMDEIDAALDFKNISIVAHYIKERTKNAQFIIISLRSNMFELSDYLVGIYKVKDCTDSVCIQNVPPKMPLTETQQHQQTQSQTQMMHSQPAHLHEVILDTTNTNMAQPSQLLVEKCVSLNDSIDTSPPHPPAAAADPASINVQLATPPPQQQLEQQNNEENCIPSAISQTLSQDSNANGRPSNQQSFASQLSIDGRNSVNMTFMPQSESTALSQALSMDMTRTSNIPSTAINDNQFKKPLPPVTTN